MTAPTDTKPNGPVAAAFAAAGVGSIVLGIFVVLNEVSEDLSRFLRFDDSFGLGSGVGPLSGKVTLAVIAYVVSWAILHAALRGKEVNFRAWFIASLALVGAGFLLTFPPVFRIFAS
ncbi:MAG: hypothetical protein FIA92_17600 [Chloroflexi bacterium]|nr:hypothetical protein [Chloroflexota bacterium]